MKKIIFIATILLSLSFSAQKIIDDQFHGWVVYQGNHKLNNHFDIHTEYQWRRTDGFNDWQQSLTRIGLDYKWNPNFTISGGHAWVLTFPYGSQPIAHQTNENRLWQQANFKAQYGSIQFQHRYRLEQRWLGASFVQRIRYRLQFTIPLQKTYLEKGKGLFMNVNNEVFLGFGRGIGKNILDQNRYIAAVGYKVSPNFNFQVGYLNQILVKSNGIQIERNHTLWTSIVYNIDFTKK